jgi:hypothetical protein
MLTAAVIVTALLQGPLTSLGLADLFVALCLMLTLIVVAATCWRSAVTYDKAPALLQKMFLIAVLTLMIVTMANTGIPQTNRALTVLVLAFLLGIAIKPIENHDFTMSLRLSWVTLLIVTALSLILLVIEQDPSSQMLAHTSGYLPPWSWLTPTPFRWVSLWGGPLPTGVAAAMLVILGQRQRKSVLLISLLLGLPALLLASSRTATISFLISGALLITVSQSKAVRRIGWLCFVAASTLLAGFILSSGITGRASLWAQILANSPDTLGITSGCGSLDKCSRAPNSNLEVPEWAGDTHNSFVEILTRDGWIGLALISVIGTISVIGWWRLPKMQRTLSLAFSLPLFAYAMVSPVLIPGTFNFASVGLLLFGLYATAGFRESEVLVKTEH